MANEKTKIILDGDVSPLRQKLREAGRAFQTLGDDAQNSLTGLGNIATSAAGRITALGAAVAGLGFGAAAKSALDQADAIDEMSQRTGLAVETLAALKFAGRQTGVEFDRIGDAAKKLGKLMIESSSGNEEASRTLKAFGVTGQQIRDVDIEGALKRIANTIAALPAAARQGALENLARGFGDLVPLLQDGAAGIEAFRQKAEQLGVISGIKAAAADAGEFNDALDRLSDTVTGFGQRAVGGVLPELTAMVDGFGQTLLAAEQNRDVLTSLGVTTLGVVLTNALRGLTVNLASAVSGWWASMQVTRQDAAAKLAHARSVAASAQAVRAHAAMLVADAEAAVASAAGMARLTVVQNTLTPARARLTAATQAATAAENALAVASANAAAKTTLSGLAVGALGGPLGVIVTLIGLAGTAWAVFGGKAKDGLDTAIGRADDLLSRMREINKFGKGDVGTLRAGMAANEKNISELSNKVDAGNLPDKIRAQAARELMAAIQKQAEYQKRLNEILADEAKVAGEVASADEVRKKALDDFNAKLGGGKKEKDQKDKSIMPQLEAELAQQKAKALEENALRDYSKQQELAFWQQKKDLVAGTANDQLAIARKVAGLTVEIARQSAADQKALNAQDISAFEAYQLAKVEERKKTAEAEVASGKITKTQLLEQEQAYENQRLAIQSQAVANRIALAATDPNTSLVEKAKLENDLQQLQMQSAGKQMDIIKQLAEARRADAKETENIWDNLGQTMSGLWDKGVQAMMNGTLTWRNAFRAVGTEMTRWFATQVVGKQVHDWLFGEAAKTGATEQGVLIRFAAESWAALKSVALWAWAAITNIATSAWQAMAGVWAAISSIPYVGPFLAPVMAAAAFAGVIALASNIKSAEGGYDIPAGLNPMTQLHEEEMVLPQKYANVIRGLAGGDGQVSESAGGSPVVLNFHSAYQDKAGIRRLLLDNGPALADAIRKAARNGN